jgi:hypothetical protein
MRLAIYYPFAREEYWLAFKKKFHTFDLAIAI